MEVSDQARPDDVACDVCREPAAPERTRLVARREDLIIFELHCPACASVTLGFTFAEAGGTAPEAIRLAGGAPISADDVLDMHGHLDAWQGDLRSLLEGRAGAGGPGR
jgi:hypothetical protein